MVNRLDFYSRLLILSNQSWLSLSINISPLNWVIVLLSWDTTIKIKKNIQGHIEFAVTKVIVLGKKSGFAISATRTAPSDPFRLKMGLPFPWTTRSKLSCHTYIYYIGSRKVLNSITLRHWSLNSSINNLRETTPPAHWKLSVDAALQSA